MYYVVYDSQRLPVEHMRGYVNFLDSRIAVSQNHLDKFFII